MNNEMKPRNLYLDAMKGLAIILVVLGHSIQINTINFDNNIFFRIIYSFHMPLFMFISGAIAWKYPTKLNRYYIVKKFNRLALPFLTWYLVSFIISGLFIRVPISSYMLELIKSPDVGLWFLWVLFLGFVLLFIILKFLEILNLSKYSDLIILLGAICIKFIPFNIFGLGLLKWHFLFFIAGYITAKHTDILRRWKYFLQIASLFAFPIFVFGWTREGNFLFLPLLKHTSYKIIFKNIQNILTIYSIAVPFLGFIFVSFIFEKVRSNKFIYKFLVLIGKYTFDIYAIQSILFFGIGKLLISQLNFGIYPIRVIWTTIMVLLLCIGISFILIRPYKILRVLLLGERITL